MAQRRTSSQTSDAAHAGNVLATGGTWRGAPVTGSRIRCATEVTPSGWSALGGGVFCQTDPFRRLASQSPQASTTLCSKTGCGEVSGSSLFSVEQGDGSGNSKLQVPSSKEIPKPKFQLLGVAPRQRFRPDSDLGPRAGSVRLARQCQATPPFDIWSLELFWNLELGLWSFSHTHSTENSGEPSFMASSGWRRGRRFYQTNPF